MAKCFIIGETNVTSGLMGMLEAIGAKDWNGGVGAHPSELLVEVCGRICYKSFGTDLNKNLTKVREGNRDYIENILKSRHGSVMEHASTSVGIIGCSRILTHELVRHRAGVAISQESQRFVRLDEFDVYIPNLDEPLAELVKNQHPDWNDQQVKNEVSQFTLQFVEILDAVSNVAKGRMATFIRNTGLDAYENTFNVKKQITSALRRFIPGGVNTNIICTANHRAWRHMIAMRTSPGAEIEIREVFADIATQFLLRYPNFYQDMMMSQTDLTCAFKHDKI